MLCSSVLLQSKRTRERGDKKPRLIKVSRYERVSSVCAKLTYTGMADSVVHYAIHIACYSFIFF